MSDFSDKQSEQIEEAWTFNNSSVRGRPRYAIGRAMQFAVTIGKPRPRSAIVSRELAPVPTWSEVLISDLEKRAIFAWARRVSVSLQISRARMQMRRIS